MTAEDEEIESPAEKARRMRHHEPAFSLRKMAEESRREHNAPQHEDIVPHFMQDSSQESENLMKDVHVPSASDRLRALLADQTDVEEEHQKHPHAHPHHELPEEMPSMAPEDQLSASEEEDQSMEEEEKSKSENGMTLEDVQTISQIRELNKKAMSVKIPRLSDVARIRDLLEPEEIFTQTLLKLDNLIVSDFSRPFRKQVIQYIQQQLKHIDDMKKEFREFAPKEES